LKSNFATGNQLQENGNRLPESKNSGNLENFEKNSFEKQNCAMFVFWKIFSILPLWSLLDFFFFFNLEFIFSWILKSNFSWFSNLVLEIILLYSFGLFLIIFVIIKTTWINLIHHHEACFYNCYFNNGWTVHAKEQTYIVS